MAREGASGRTSDPGKNARAMAVPMPRPLRDLLSKDWLRRVRAGWRRVAGGPAAGGVGTTSAVPGAPETSEGMLRRLEWTVLRPLASRLGGDERSLVRGFGLELSDLREYQPGDDVRHIDWNTTARTDRPYVREAYAERALDVWLVVDVSPSVDWGTVRRLKRDVAVDLTAVVGLLLGRQGNRIGALLFAERPRALVPPGTGRAHLLRLLTCLRDEPRRDGVGRTDLAAALAQIRLFARRRSLILIVSDFLVDDGWQAVLGPLAQRHEVVAVRLRDPREAGIPDVGLVALEDPETGDQFLVDMGDRRLRDRFAEAAVAQEERLRTDLARHGVDQLVLSTSEDLMPMLVRFLGARKHRRGRVGAPSTQHRAG
jgi:uncharacterized protein (DUF58 family)